MVGREICLFLASSDRRIYSETPYLPDIFQCRLWLKRLKPHGTIHARSSDQNRYTRHPIGALIRRFLLWVSRSIEFLVTFVTHVALAASRIRELIQ